MPKVSVIVPVYGVEKYIERCARSLFEQTLDDIEYLFIDDCSPDKSIDILKRVLDEYPNRKAQVTIHRMAENSGQAAVREWGMKNATGDFVIHCDSDDWVERSAYQEMYDMAVTKNADVVICDFVLTDGVDILREFKGCDSIDKEHYLRLLLSQKNAWSLVNKLFRIKLYYDNSFVYPKRNMGEDMAICLQLIMRCQTIAYIQRPFYSYFYNPSSICHMVKEEQKMRNFCDDRENLEILLKAFSERQIDGKYAAEIAYLKWRVKTLLWQTKFDSDKYVLWRESYPELDKKILFMPEVKLIEKLKYYLTNLRLYLR